MSKRICSCTSTRCGRSAPRLRSRLEPCGKSPRRFRVLDNRVHSAATFYLFSHYRSRSFFCCAGRPAFSGSFNSRVHQEIALKFVVCQFVNFLCSVGRRCPYLCYCALHASGFSPKKDHSIKVQYMLHVICTIHRLGAKRRRTTSEICQ